MHHGLPLHRLLRRCVDVEAGEVRATLLGFCWFFCLLGGYYLLRPLRDALGLAGGAQELQWLFSGTFVAMLMLVPLFGALVARWWRACRHGASCRWPIASSRPASWSSAC